MHELSVCQALISQVEQIAAENGADSITHIVVRMGPLSGVVPELLQRAYPLASAGTIAKNAELEIEESSVQIRCSQCSAVTDAQPNHLVCAKCGEWRTEILSGDELILSHVELEKLKPNETEIMH